MSFAGRPGDGSKRCLTIGQGFDCSCGPPARCGLARRGYGPPCLSRDVVQQQNSGLPNRRCRCDSGHPVLETVSKPPTGRAYRRRLAASLVVDSPLRGSSPPCSLQCSPLAPPWLTRVLKQSLRNASAAFFRRCLIAIRGPSIVGEREAGEWGHQGSGFLRCTPKDLRPAEVVNPQDILPLQFQLKLQMNPGGGVVVRGDRLADITNRPSMQGATRLFPCAAS